MFYPEAVAVIGASSNPQKWGFGILHNLIQGGYKGRIFPINPSQKEILGIKCYPSVSSVPYKIDLAVIVVPPEKVFNCVIECGEKGVGSLVIITAGFAESGERYRKYQEDIAQEIKKYGMLAIGPNCQGIMCTQSNLFAQFVWLFPAPGKISIISQSGNVGASLIGRGIFYGIGFGKFISSGNEAVVKSSDLLEYLAEDQDTSVIMAYIEGVGEGEKFFKALSKTTPKKPVIILKGGTTDAGNKACASHTGVMAGQESIFSSACRQAGAILVDNLDDLFYASVTLAHQPLPKGDRVGILTWGGGWGVIAADSCVRQGLKVPPLPEDVIEKISHFLSYRWSHNNPVDLAASGGRDALSKALEVMIKSDAFDGIIQLGIGVSSFMRYIADSSFFFNSPDRAKLRKIMIEYAIKQDEEMSRKIIELSFENSKPVLCASDTASTPSPDNVAWQILKEKGMLIYPTPTHASKAFAWLVRYSEFLKKRANS